uniref:Uncharacterized protein n=1 Tax=Oryza rufipogon TaxID=4529 RepID=A0A0E0R7E4_ORYRU
MRAPRQGQRRAGRPSRSLLVPPLARRKSSLSSSPACAGGDRGNDGDGEGAEREESSSVRAAASGTRIPLLAGPTTRQYGRSLAAHPAPCAGGDRGNDGDGEGAEREESSSVRAAASGTRIPPLAGPTTRQYGRSLAAHPARLRLSSYGRSLAAHPARLRLSSVRRRRRARQRMGKGCRSYEDDRKVNGEEMIIILQNFSGTKWISRIVVAFF